MTNTQLSKSHFQYNFSHAHVMRDFVARKGHPRAPFTQEQHALITQLHNYKHRRLTCGKSNNSSDLNEVQNKAEQT